MEANFLINVSMKFDVNSVKFAYRLKAGDMLCKYTMSKVKWYFEITNVGPKRDEKRLCVCLCVCVSLFFLLLIPSVQFERCFECPGVYHAFLSVN